jgi:hypothetical protein
MKNKKETTVETVALPEDAAAVHPSVEYPGQDLPEAGRPKEKRQKRSPHESLEDSYRRLFSATERLLSAAYPNAIEGRFVKFDKCILHVTPELYALLKDDRERGGMLTAVLESNNIRFLCAE